jgi:hypothetical protein
MRLAAWQAFGETRAEFLIYDTRFALRLVSQR